MSAPTQKLLKRHVAAVVAGNALEFYDFLTFTFFALYIAKAFFPNVNETSSLLATLAAFGAGFITRPIGAVVIGSFGDRIGRRPAMFFSFTLMGVAIVGMALTPSFASIGIAAPILVLFFRLLQGFALGGEVGPTTAFLIEAPPPANRGFYASLQSASQYISTFAAGLAGTGLTFVLTPAQLQSWGWRAAFLLGAAAVPFGLIVRRSLPETMHAASAHAERASALVRRHAGDAAFGLSLLAHATICTYVLLYLATYAQHTLHMKATYAFASTLLIGLAGSFSAPLSGALSDRVGRKPVMIVATLILICVTIPAFAAAERIALGRGAAFHGVRADRDLCHVGQQLHRHHHRIDAAPHPLRRHRHDLCARHRRVRRQRTIQCRLAHRIHRLCHRAGLLHDRGACHRFGHHAVRARNDREGRQMNQPKRLPIRHVVAVTLENGLEFYDFLSYSIFAVYIAKAYFPLNYPAVSLIGPSRFSWAAYLMRIVGAIYLGGLGDRIGRKPAMLISFACMGSATLAMALTPTYATIGIAAPIIVVVFRLLQGFALGGEVGPTTAYMIEAAPPERRGFYCSMQYVSQDVAVADRLGCRRRAVEPAHRAAIGKLGLARRVPARRGHHSLRHHDLPLAAGDPAQGRRRGAGPRRDNRKSHWHRR